ncbi:MAG: Spy/CpxP family protein refolding chaperone, partial [Bdellovibrionota bacterium]
MKSIMRTFVRTLSVGFFALTLGVSVGHAKGGEHRGGGFRKMTDELNLTVEQKEKAKKIHSEGREGMKAKRDAMKAIHDDLEKAIKGAASDDEVRSKFAALLKAQDEFSKARFEKVIALRAILTPEQRTKLKNQGGKHKGEHGGGHGDEHG